MKKFGLLFASTLALLTLAACDNEEDDVNKEDQYDDAYYAAQAIIYSSDTAFSDNADGGTISFKAAGGAVTLNVSCGCDWTVDNDATGLFTTSMTTTTLTVTAEQNLVESELTGTLTVKTANEGIVFATISIVQAAYGAPEITVSTNEWNAPAVGVLTTEIAVEASDEWSIENTTEWLTVEKTDTGISLTATENEGTEERAGEVVLTCTDGINSDSETITVTQDAKAYITLSGETLAFSSDEGSASVTVESNFDLTCSTEANWFTVTVDGSVLTVAVEENETGEDREETVTLTAGDGAANVAEALLTVSQNTISADDMVLTYYISEEWLAKPANDNEVYLPLAADNGTPKLNCTINWGDGSELEFCNDDLPSHNYTKAGEYDIIISGTMPVLYSYDITRYGSGYVPVTAVKQWGNTGLMELLYAFYNCESLVSLPEDTAGALDNVTTFYEAFHFCSSLAEIPAGLFNGCTQATSFYLTFSGCSSLKEIPKEGIFNGCTKANSCYALFQNCTSLTEIPEGLFDDFTEVTNFSTCFSGCTGLITVPTSLFDKNLKVTNFSSCFNSCSSVVGESPYTTTSDGTKIHLYERSANTDVLGCSSPTSYSNCFSGSSFSDIDSIPSNWGGKN